MRKFLLLWVVLASSLAFSQLATVTATITDSDGTTWANGSWIATLQPNPSASPNVLFQGSSNFTKQFQGSLSGTGSFSQASVPRNDFITPSGSTWTFTICPNAYYACSIVTNVSITSGAVNLSATLSTGAKAPRMAAGPNTYGYADVEIGTPASPVWPGATYFNVSGLTYRQWNGSSWITIGTGGGGGTPGGANSQMQYNCSGSFCGTADFTYASSVLSGGSTLTFSLGSTSHTTPHVVNVSANKPATCGVGEEFFATDAPTGQNLYFCTSTNVWTQMTGGGIAGPGSSTVGNLATWNNTGGTSIADSGIASATVNTNASNFITGDLIQAAGNHSTADSGIAANTLVTAASPFSSGNVVQAAGSNRTTSDSGVVAANLVTTASPFVSGHIPKAAASNKTLSDGYGVQGTDTNLITAGTVSGTGVTLCTDANGGATTSGCTGGATVNSALQFANTYYSAAGTANTLSGVAPPTTNGFWVTGYNVTTGTAVAPANFLQGVPVNLQTGNYSVLYSDRASYIKEQAGTTATITLPQVAGNTASNFAFITQNLNSGTETLTANAVDKIDGGALGGSSTIPTQWIAWVYQDSSSAPGNWWTVKVPSLGAFPGCSGAASALTFNSTIFGCNNFTFSSFSPAPTRAGDVIYYNGSTWVTLPGNNSGTQVFTENASGVPSWTPGGGGGSTALSSVTAATGSNSISNGNFPQTWNWSQTTNSQSAFTFGETVAATGTGDIELNVQTLASSTALPIQVTARGTANGVQMTTAGLLQAIGSGGISATTGNATQLNGTNFTGTNGDLVSFGAANIPADSGVVASNVVTDTATPAANQLAVFGGTSKVVTPTTTLPTAAMPALSGDLSGSGGSLSVSVVGLHFGASAVTLGTVPANGQCLVNNAGVINGTACSGGSISGLTTNAIVTAASATTIQTPSATATMDASGNISTPGSVTTTGAGAGVFYFGQGTAQSTGTTAVGITAPTSVTSYNIVLPAAAGTGIPLLTNAANIDTMSFLTSAANGDLLVGNGTTWTKFAGNAAGTKILQEDASGNASWVAAGAGTVTSVATTSPITGGTFTTSGTIGCATCTTNAAALTSGNVVSGAGGQATQDSGVVASQLTTSASAAAAANMIEVSAGASRATSFVDFPDIKIVPAANCNNATAGPGWDLPASNSPTVACRAGTNNLDGVLQWANNNTTTNAQFSLELPADWDTGTQPYISIYYGSGANTSGTVKWTVSSACTKNDGSVTDDPAFVAETTSSGKTMAVANRMWSESLQFANMTSGNNCVAGSSVIIKIASGNGTATSTVNVSKVVLTIPRRPVVQAN